MAHVATGNESSILDAMTSGKVIHVKGRTKFNGKYYKEATDVKIRPLSKADIKTLQDYYSGKPLKVSPPKMPSYEGWLAGTPEAWSRGVADWYSE